MKTSRKRYVEGSLLEWAQTLKMSVSHMNAQSVPTVEEAFNNQVNKMTFSLGVKLFPQTPQMLINGPINEVDTEAEMENTQS